MPSAIWKKGTKDTSSLFELRRTKDRCAKGLCSSRWICCQWEFAAGGNSKFRSAFKSFVFERSGHLSSCGFETSFGTSPTEVHSSPLSFVFCPCVFCPHLWVRDFLRNLTQRSETLVLCPLSFRQFFSKTQKKRPFSEPLYLLTKPNCAKLKL